MVTPDIFSISSGRYIVVSESILSISTTEIPITPIRKPIAVSKTVLGDDFSAATSGRSTTSTPPALVILTISVGATFANDFQTSQANSALFDLITTSSN